MSIQLTVRQKDIAESDQEYARRKAEAILDEFKRIKAEHVHVILNLEKHLNIAEITVQAGNHVRVEAKETGANMHASIDAVVEKASRQLRKHLEKIRDHRAARRHSESARIGGAEE